MNNTTARPTGVEEREATFWDAQVSRLDEAALRAQTVEMDASNRCRMELLGEVRGKRVLDVGCGTGLWSAFLAQQGAEVWAVDISPQSIALTQRRAEAQGVGERVHASVMSATALTFPDGFFDRVHGQDIIHHLDATAFGSEIARVLAPEGRAVFSENCANNALLMFARNKLCGRWGIPKWSSGDEYPLTAQRLAEFSRFFAHTIVRYPVFFFFHYLNAKLFHYKSRVVNGLCHGADSFVYRFLPFLRRYSYRQLLCCSGPRRAGKARR